MSKKKDRSALCEGSKVSFVYAYFELLELLNHENRRLGSCAHNGDNIKMYI